MRPFMSNSDKQHLLGIVEAVTRIEQYIESFHNAEELYNSQLHFDAVLMNFVTIDEMVDKLSPLFKQNYSHVDWVKIKGFRNSIAHDYFDVDAEEVWQIIKTHMKLFKIEVEEILEKMS